MTFFDRLKLVIQEKNTTITEVEKNVGFGRGTIGKWKNSSPSYDNILKVINYLKVDLYYLMQDDLTFNVSKKNDVYSTNESNNYVKEPIMQYGSSDNLTFYEEYKNLKTDEKTAIELLLNIFRNNAKYSTKINDLSKKEKYILSIYNKLTEEDKIKIEGIIENKLYNYIQ